VGCALVAFFMGYVRRRFSETRWNELIRPFFVTGILGGFTTVSAFAVNTLFLTQDHRLYGLLYGIASIYGGFFIYGFVFKKVSA
jgi:fluoride ion exporter CrcB/FEX